MSVMHDNLMQLGEDLRLLHERIMSAIKSLFPVGSVVTAKLGNNVIIGKVITYQSYQHRLIVQNVKTGKERAVRPLSRTQQVTLLEGVK